MSGWRSVAEHKIPMVYALSYANMMRQTGGQSSAEKTLFQLQKVDTTDAMIASSLPTSLPPLPVASSYHLVFLVAQVVDYWNGMFFPRGNTITLSLRRKLLLYMPIPSRPPRLAFLWKQHSTLGKASLRFKTVRVNSMSSRSFKAWQILTIPQFFMQIEESVFHTTDNGKFTTLTQILPLVRAFCRTSSTGYHLRTVRITWFAVTVVYV